MLRATAKWSEARFLWTLLLSYLVVCDAMSWLLSRIPPCIVDASKYGAYYTENNECPTGHVFLMKSLASIFEAIGHEWVTAIATAVIAGFTATIFCINRSQLR